MIALHLHFCMRALGQLFRRIDGPTWLVALVLYGAWVALMVHAVRLPGWIVLPAGAYLVAWHFSLQHEAIHAFRGVPRWLRVAVVYPPLGLWFPFPLYEKSHSTHHRDAHLTIPGLDPESYYVYEADWERMSRWRRALLTFNQTLLGRLSIGPLLRLWTLILREGDRIRRGDRSHLRHWCMHALALGVLFGFISGVCHFPVWQYVLLVAYPGFSLGLLRAFTEHRAATDSAQRTASVETNFIFGIMYLYNNIHVVHHLNPTLPWYEIPRFYRQHRDELLSTNGHFLYRGYAELVRRFLWVPVFRPVLPRSVPRPPTRS
ncbi:MAG TPA: fatty acid desaturase [Steroidobacteraceae bacterium]|nr:fatty acid desaturase [Steroidobacteraceae bacterium]